MVISVNWFELLQIVDVVVWEKLIDWMIVINVMEDVI